MFSSCVLWQCKIRVEEKDLISSSIPSREMATEESDTSSLNRLSRPEIRATGRKKHYSSMDK